MPKYNLALTPISKSDEIVKFARLFSNLADQYLLGKDALPHVTLYQFEVEENAIEDIWRRANEAFQESSIQLDFNELSYKNFDDTLFWVSLLPNNFDKLHAMHAVIANILDQSVKQNFEPHMTLFNTKNKDYKNEVEKTSYQSITDKFILCLGHADKIGQLTKILKRKIL